MDDKHYYTLNKFYRDKFGSKVFKVSLDAGFTCPNKDGRVSKNGCIFCTLTPYIGNKLDPLKVQFTKIKEMMNNKWKDAKVIAYLEAGTNTYDTLDNLKRIYEELLSFDGVIGLNIGTRCDSISKETLDYLEELSKRTYLTIELGLQSSFDETLKLINRGHTRKQYADMVKKLKMRNITVVSHIINGLPGETKEMMIETAKFVNSLGVDGIKIHMLYLENDSTITKMYLEKPFHILTKDEYIEIVADQLKELNKNIVIHRITSDPDRNKVVEPKWLTKKFVVLNDIDKYLKINNIYQGDNVK